MHERLQGEGHCVDGLVAGICGGWGKGGGAHLREVPVDPVEDLALPVELIQGVGCELLRLLCNLVSQAPKSVLRVKL